jgi:DNA repair ATPase RecN
MGSALQSLEEQYSFLTENQGALIDACKTQAEKDAINLQYQTARLNYQKNINKAFHDGDPGVVKVVADMKTAEKNLETAVEQLNDIAKVIDAITEAVKVGTKLAGLAV